MLQHIKVIILENDVSCAPLVSYILKVGLFSFNVKKELVGIHSPTCIKYKSTNQGAKQLLLLKGVLDK